MAFSEVAVDVPTLYDRTFTYSVPTALKVAQGQAVWVPFGPRQVQGVVFEVTDEAPSIETRPILGVIGAEPLLMGYQLQLARWISSYYKASLFESAALMLPPGFSQKLISIYRSMAASAETKETLSLLQTRVLSYLEGKGPTYTEALTRAFGSGAEGAARTLLRLGLVERDWLLQKPKVGPKYLAILSLAMSPELVEEAAFRLGHSRAIKQGALLQFLARSASIPLTQANKEFGSATVSALMRKGLVQVQQVHQERNPLKGREFARETPLTLTQPQAEAVKAIIGSLEAGTSSTGAFLLQGVTGSGKTEVYLQAMAYCLSQGKGCIFLVPEIALTPQMIERLSARFPGMVGLFHSGLSLGEQYDQWGRVKRGDFPIALGSRNAIFLPQPRLGLIVIDEEHEWTYKQQDVPPRYHTREVALKLAGMTRASVVLGSATPNVETYHGTTYGRFQLLTLPVRVAKGPDGGPKEVPLARVEMADMRQELKEGNRSIFSRVLQRSIASALNAKEQVLLFLNRRGSAPLVLCRDCGYTLRCNRCDLPFTYHSVTDRLLCHSCGRRALLPKRCPRCLSIRIKFLGLGTQKVVEEVARLDPSARILRWDRDAVKERKDHEEIMARFTRGEADVLVGTQMIAKGLHIPRVSLVGVVLADAGLYLPDFRAGERTFQLSCQVAGRAGRGDAPGRVIIQTYAPENYALQAAVTQDYQDFFHKEMEFRRELGNPPFSQLVRLLYRHTNQVSCRGEVEMVGSLINERRAASGLTDIEMVGPAPAFPPRIRGYYRWHIILRGQQPERLIEGVPLPQGWIIDVDPVSLI